MSRLELIAVAVEERCRERATLVVGAPIFLDQRRRP